MISRLTVLAVFALFLGACSTGGYVTNTYTDDIYFNPADVPPPINVDEEIVAEEEAPKEKSGERLIISQIEENEDGSNTMNNYIFDGTEEDVDAQLYNMDQMDLYGSDTTVYYNDDEVKYVINNYYDGDELDYAYRIRRFHRPYFYDPFYWDSWYYDPYYYGYGYSSWYYPGWSWGWGGGWNSPYYSWSWGYSPYWYGHWHSPYYSWGYPYYSSWYGYGGYYGGWHNRVRYIDSDDYHYGRRRSNGTNVLRNTDGSRGSSDVAARNKSSVRRSSDNTTSATRRGSVDSDRSNVRNVTRAANGDVLTERRRSADNSSRTSVSERANIKSSTRTQTYTRPGSTSTRSSSSYTRPSTNYTRPRVVTKSSSGSSRYSAPRSTSSYSKYRSSSTYNRSSGRSTSGSYSTPRSSSRSSYSTPSRSSSSYRSSGSSGSYRSSGSSGSSGSYRSSGSSGSSRGSSSSSGRRR